MTEDRNADLIDYKMTFDGGSVWRVVGTCPVLGSNYILMHRDGSDGLHHYNKRVQTASAVRRRKEIEAGAA